MLEDLIGHCAGSPYTLSDQKTLKYLQSLSQIFEQGILSRLKVTATDSQLLDNIREGFQYFVGWCKEVQLQGVNADETTQTAFLAWQVGIPHTHTHTHTTIYAPPLYKCG